jgi:hypothetical protein
MFTGLHEAQVVSPRVDGRLEVLLNDYTLMGGTLTVRVLRPYAHPSAGHYQLPSVGMWGLVAFTRNDARSGVWLGSLDDDLRNLIPEELWESDRYAELSHHPSDTYLIQHGDGTTEKLWPDGSLLKLTTGKDGSVSNETKRKSRTPRKMRRKTGPMTSERQAYVPHSEPPVDVEFEHSSGAVVRITADGSFLLRTPRGHLWRMHDATEKARDPESGEATATPEEDAGRVASQVAVESETGHQLIFMDDPQSAANDRYVKLETAAGHVLELRDLAPDDQHVKLETAAGVKAELRDTPIVKATIETPGGRSFVMDDDAAQTVVTDPTVINTVSPVANVMADEVNLAGGGPGVARLGDQVTIVIPSGSSAGTYIGYVTSSSDRTFSG